MLNSLETQTNERKVLSITALNRKAKGILEMHLPIVWVEGEISNFSKPSSGHWYFSLKDDTSQVRCAMFRGKNMMVKAAPKAGNKVLVRARVSLYEGRGDFQLIVEHLEDAGFGELQRRYDALKAKLHGEGLFAEAHKKPLPKFPSHVAVVTSSTAAALHDVINVLKRRCPFVTVTLSPSLVQGEQAEASLIEALSRISKYNANQAHPIDAIILCRGGGSIEDLWAFNGEALARAIYAMDVPIVSGIGHEIDFTIADYVADLRAPTPSAAAELVATDSQAILQQFKSIQAALEKAISQKLRRKQDAFALAVAGLQHPGQRIEHWMQNLDALEMRLSRAIRSNLLNKSVSLNNASQSLRPSILLNKQKQHSEKLSQLDMRSHNALKKTLSELSHRAQRAVSALNTLSPLSTLQRGFAIAKRENGEVVRKQNQVQQAEILDLTLSEGKLKVEVL